MRSNVYLVFNGTCRQAMQFYAKCLGGDLQLMPFSEAPKEMCPPGAASKDLIMHARLTKGDAVIMASDGQPGQPLKIGDNFSVSLLCDSVPEIERIYGAFREGGKVTMELGETFWAVRFGMLTDRFGVNWMFNLEKPMGKEKA